jgi:nucleotide-binding universal stress UspA family protein
MFRTILIPLDGSPFAEQALPHALGIARRGGAALDLVHVHVLYVLEEHIVARYAYDPEIDVIHRRQEQLYLDATAKWLATTSPVSIRAAIVDGLGAEGILQRAQADHADLIVMTTHGRGPLSRFFLGSVADEVLRRAAVPVLLIRPRQPAPSILPEPPLEHVLVPLDGSALAERVLEPALDLVRLGEGRCTLLRIVEAKQQQSSPTDQEAAAKAYLEKIADRLREEGVSVQTCVVAAPHAAPAIVEEAAKQRCDFIALATHGRGGARRMLLGSVADKVVRSTDMPVLVYRPKRD